LVEANSPLEFILQKRQTTIVFLLFVVGATFTSGSAWYDNKKVQMGFRASTKDLSGDGLVMVSPSDGPFDEMFSRVEQSSPGLKSLRPYTVFVHNTGKRPVIAFALKWNFVRPNGQVETRTHQFVSNSSLIGKGASDSDAGIIRPDATWLFTSEFGTEVGSPQAIQLGKQDQYLARVGADLSNFTGASVSLDGAIFDDGTFIGADETGFFAKIVALRDSHRDIINDIAKKFREGKSHEQILDELETLTKLPKIRLGKNSTSSDYYNYFRRDYADELLLMKKAAGPKRTLEYALETHGKQWPTLKKANATK
jgi:hypothetical protein